MTPWDEALSRRRAIKRRTRWQDRGLDAATARAVEALLNGPRPPRAVSALALEDADVPGRWVVLVQRVQRTGGDGRAEVLTTLGACAPYVGEAMRQPSGGAWWKRNRLADLALPSGPGPEEVAPPPAAERQVRRELDAATGDTTARAIGHEQEGRGGGTTGPGTTAAARPAGTDRTEAGA